MLSLELSLIAGLSLLLLAMIYFLFKSKVQLAQLTQEVKNQEATVKDKEKEAQLYSSHFKSMAQDIFDGNSRQFLEVAKTILNKESSLTKADLESRQQHISSLVAPIKELLEKQQGAIHEIEKNRVQSFTEIGLELKKLTETSSRLSQETTSLKDALKKPHIRGRWGEVQLKNCIELAGMSEFCDVTFQDLTDTSEGRLIPDMTVKMPGGHLVVVDAKTPLDGFIAYLEAQTDEDKRIQLERHARHIKEHIRKLSQKAYHDSIVGSADFTVMFLPNESFIYAALEVDSTLMEFAIEKKILIATPPTFIGLLKVIAYGWREDKLSENAKKISEAGVELHKRVADFVEAYNKVGDSLNKAQQEYQRGLTRLESRVLTQAKRLEDLGASSNKGLDLNHSTTSATSTEDLSQ